MAGFSNTTHLTQSRAVLRSVARLDTHYTPILPAHIKTFRTVRSFRQPYHVVAVWRPDDGLLSLYTTYPEKEIIQSDSETMGNFTLLGVSPFKVSAHFERGFILVLCFLELLVIKSEKQDVNFLLTRHTRKHSTLKSITKLLKCNKSDNETNSMSLPKLVQKLTRKLKKHWVIAHVIFIQLHIFPPTIIYRVLSRHMYK